MAGVKRGYKHNWKYSGHWHEQKRKGGWDIDFTASKRRRGSAKGGLPIGSKLLWKIEGYQTAEKVSGRTYKTRLKAKKKLVRVKVTKRKRRKRR